MPTSSSAIVLLVAIIAAILAASLALHSVEGGQKPTIVVCNAGSLTLPLEEIAKDFEKHYGIQVLIEPSGSVEAVRKVTDYGKNCDIVAVADYRLIPLMMVPWYTSWYIVFATNSMVISVNKELAVSNSIAVWNNSVKALELLLGSRYGFSDPNRDPCGYRAVGVIGLAALEEHNLSLLEHLVIDKIPGSRYKLVNGTLHI